MSIAFQEFLRHRSESQDAATKNAVPTINEWRSSVEALFLQIRDWLKVSDPTGLIEIDENLERINEPSLGLYSVSRLDLRAFGKWIGIIPKARKTIGTATPSPGKAPERAQGRVDITDELRRFILYRFREGERDVWMIDDMAERSWPGEVRFVRGPQLLDQESFEKALMSYLQ